MASMENDFRDSFICMNALKWVFDRLQVEFHLFKAVAGRWTAFACQYYGLLAFRRIVITL